MHLQDRYLFKKLSKAFIVVLSALIVLFLLIDYALQSKGFAGFYYYGAKISSFADPSSFCLSSIFSFCSFGAQQQKAMACAASVPSIFLAALKTLLFSGFYSDNPPLY